MVVKSWYDGSGSNTCNGVLCGAGAIGNVANALTLQGQRFKLDDDFIRRGIIGE
jgi:hypothetical protein